MQNIYEKNSLPMRYGALYIRVSTDKQEELSPDAQKRLLLEYAKAHSIFISPEHIFIEHGISGRNANKRPEFQRMIALAKSPEAPFSVILVWKFSRFARNQEESIVYKSMLKKQCHVDVLSITEPLIDGPFGSLIERIIEWMDEYYSINLSGEVIRGMTEKALQGGYQCSPPLGYASPGHNLPFVVVSDEAEIVKYIFDQFANQHRDATSIARSLNRLGKKTKRGSSFEKRNITYILRNRFYIGEIIWNGIEQKGKHEIFISEEIFASAGEHLDSNYAPKRRRNVSTTVHWLSGLVKCSSCGASLGFNRTTRSGGNFFNCWKYAKGMHPGSAYISEKMLSTGVIEYFEKLLSGQNFEFSYHISVAIELDGATQYEKELEKLSARERRIREAYEVGIDTLDEYRDNKKRLLTERRRLLELFETLKPKPPADPVTDKEKMLANIKTVYDILKDDSVGNETKGVFLRSVVEEIIWNRKENTLSFYLYMPRKP